MLHERSCISMTDATYGAKLQRDGKTYAIQTRIPAGVVTPAELETIARVAKKYAIPLVKITSGQRFLLVGVQEKDIAGVRTESGAARDGIHHARSPVRSVLPGHLGTVRMARRTPSPSQKRSRMSMPVRISRPRSRSASRAVRGAAGIAGSGTSESWEPLRAGR